MNFLARFAYSFRRNNNTRSWFFLATALLCLATTILVFGFGSETHTSMSETAQKYYNLEYKGQFATDAQIAGLWGAVKNFFGWSWSALRWVAYTFSFVYLLFSIIYWFVARRDEVGRAWERAERAVSERVSGSEELRQQPATQPTTQTTPQAAQSTISQSIVKSSFLKLFSMELLAEFISKIPELFRKRRA